MSITSPHKYSSDDYESSVIACLSYTLYTLCQGGYLTQRPSPHSSAKFPTGFQNIIKWLSLPGTGLCNEWMIKSSKTAVHRKQETTMLNLSGLLQPRAKNQERVESV